MAKGKNQGSAKNPPSTSGNRTQATDLAPAKISRISWSYPEHAARTTRLITYCKDHNDFHLKLFLDSTEEATQQGWPRRQLTTSRDHTYQTLACAVFEHDSDPELKQVVVAHLTLFVAPMKRRFNTYVQHFVFYDLNHNASTDQSF